MNDDLPSYVVDASVALKWAVRTDEPFLTQADLLLDDYQRGLINLIAPIHLASEFGHGLVRAIRMGRLERDDAQNQLHYFLSLQLLFYAHGDFYHDAIDLARVMGCSFYDATYVALARKRGVYLIHADEPLQTKLASQPYALYRWLGDYRSGLR